ncbi:hypothetical protein CBF17_020365, partial [Pantoea agglomerans]
VFEQRNALARLRAHLRDEVRNRAGRACHGWRVLRLSDLSVFSKQARSHSQRFRIVQSGPPGLSSAYF